ncbi:hypothetical protein K435DRAFT_661700, partial [Dendrothele bispora CBS 962.96]
LFIDPTVDGHLCPFCDSSLPPFISPYLQQLLDKAKAKSQGNPRPGNPQGMSSSLEVWASVCARHQFESDLLPEAERQGWPTEIAWGTLKGRIESLKPKLVDLVNNSYVSVDGGERVRARDICVFWKEAIEEAQTLGGSRNAGKVRNQYLNFDKSQLGYYGERGWTIVYQVVSDMFPINQQLADFRPLVFNTFMERILVPEVSKLLIMEDKGLEGSGGAVEAVSVMRQSSRYGVAMFPEANDIGEESDGGGLSDDLMLLRANKKREELIQENDFD